MNGVVVCMESGDKVVVLRVVKVVVFINEESVVLNLAELNVKGFRFRGGFGFRFRWIKVVCVSFRLGMGKRCSSMVVSGRDDLCDDVGWCLCLC